MISRRFLGCVLLLGISASSLQAQEPEQPESYFLPAHCLARLGSAEFRHGSRIECLAYTPDGKLLAAGGGNDPIRIWVTKTGEQLRICSEPSVQALLFHPRGRLLISGGAFKTIRIWDATTGKVVIGGQLVGHDSSVKSLAISRDGMLLVSGGADGLIHLWDFQGRRSTGKIRGHSDEINALALSDDGKTLASVSSDRTLQIWNLEQNNQLVHKIDVGCCALAVAFGPDNTVYSAGDDAVIRQWDLKSGKEIASLQGHDGLIVSLMYRPDEQTLVSGSRDGTVRYWKANQQTKVLKRDTGDCLALALTSDGRYAASAGTNNVIRILDTESGKETPPIGSLAPLTSLVLTHTGSSLLSANSAGKLMLWDLDAAKLARQWDAKPGEISLALSPDSKTLASAGRDVVLWDLETATRRFELPPLEEIALIVRFSPDGKTIAVGMQGHTVALWDLELKKRLLTIKHSAPAYAIAFSVDGQKLVVSGGTRIAVFESATGKGRFYEFECMQGKGIPLVASLLCSPDQKTFVAGCYDGVIRTYRLDDPAGKEQFACVGHSSVPYALAFSRDGRMLASGSFDRTVRIWEAFSARPIVVFPGHLGPVTSLAFSPDDQKLYSASADTSILTWDVTGRKDPETRIKMTMNADELENVWKQLASEEAGKGHHALWQIVDASKDAVPFLKKKLYLIDPEEVRKLIRDLDSESFTHRSRAMRRIESFGRWMEGRLKLNLQDQSSLEARRRSEQLIERLDVPGSLSLDQERMRLRRFMLALEHIGDEQAQGLFQDLTKRGPEEDFQEEARVSLSRLDRRVRAGL